MIELSSVSIRAGDFILPDISFRLNSGDYAAIMGRTGIGKTTILEAICGLRTVEKGSILIDGSNVTSWPAGDRNLGYVPQDLTLFPTMTVEEHLTFAMKLRKFKRSACLERAKELAELLGISHLLARRPAGLSGGEAQRVALGRALSFRPSCLLLDEPLSALDAGTRDSALDLLRSINKLTGVTVIHVTHNADEAAAIANVVLTLASGDRPGEVVLSNEAGKSTGNP